MPAPVTAALLLIGNELLSGKIVDQNGQLAIATLRRRGIDLIEVRIVADDEAAIGAAARELAARATFVITSGGIGPTHDDITLASIAAGFGLEMQEEPALRAWIDQHFAARPAELAVWRRMAMVPVGAEIHTDSRTMWPLTQVRNLFVLPGVPQLFANQLRAVVARFDGQPVALATLFLTCGEGEVAAHLEAVLAAEPAVALGSYPVWGADDYRTRITVESREAEAVARATAALSLRFGSALVRVEQGG